MKYDELIKQFMIESTSYKKGDEIDYSIGKLKSLLNKGYGVKVIATGGGMADSKEFGDDTQKADYVKKAKEKNKIDIIVNNAKDELKYVIEPKLKNKGRKLVIVITDEPISKIEEAEKSIADKEKFIMDHGMTIGGSKTTDGGKVYHIKYLDTGSTTGGFVSKEEAINNAYRQAMKKK